MSRGVIMPQASSIIIADSISPEGIRLTTFQLQYWRGIHSEFMTHRVFSRNAGSSRARPSKAIIEQVRDDPWGPIHWGANEPGMQANTELDQGGKFDAKNTWATAAWHAAKQAEIMVGIGAHKQIVNRLLEPFTYIDVVVTATDYANWFALRDHADAQPEIRELAQLMREVYDHSEPKLLQPGEWHLPYVTQEDWDTAASFIAAARHGRGLKPAYAPMEENVLSLLKKVSAARCARVSYKLFDGTKTDFDKDLELFDRLLVSQPLHASPAEHQATPDVSYNCPITTEKVSGRKYWGNFNGWIQHRKMLPNEFVAG